MVPGGHLRATHDDRNRVVELLRVAAGDGRLTLQELDERVGAALTARTYRELAVLVSDLPAAPESPAGASEMEPKDEVRIDCHSATARRDGPWMVPRRMQVQVTSGSVSAGLHRGGHLAAVAAAPRDGPRWEPTAGDQAGHPGEHRRPGGPGQQREGACAMGSGCAGQVPDRCGRHSRQRQFQGAPATPQVVAVAAAAPLPLPSPQAGPDTAARGTRPSGPLAITPRHFFRGAPAHRC
jgi:Domain of unknown function (DUF1707)